MSKDRQIHFLDSNLSLPLWVTQVGHEECTSLHSFGPAVRDHYLLHFIVKGSGVYKKENKESFNYETVTPKRGIVQNLSEKKTSEMLYSLHAGEGFLISPNTITTYIADQENPWEYYWIGINGTYAKSLLKTIAISKSSPCFKFEDNNEFYNIFTNIINNQKNGYSRDLDIVGEFYKLLANISGIAHKNNSAFSSPEIYLNSAVQYIQNNYAYDISVNKIAHFIGIDRTYLYKIFMTNLSMSVEQYIIETRLQNAQNLLITTNYTILQIALSTGFYDLSHFSNSFRKHFNMSPTEYRKKILFTNNLSSQAP